MKFEGKKVLYARLHAPSHIPSVGILGPVLNGTESKDHKSYDMVIDSGFLRTYVEDLKTLKKRTLIIPLEAFEFLEIETDDTAVPSIKAKK